MSSTLSTIIEVKCLIQNRDSFLNYLSPTASKLKETLMSIPNYDCKNNSLWTIARDFDIGNECYFVLENNLGFSIDYNPNDSIAMLNLTCSWQKFCTDPFVHDIFKKCTRKVCNALEGDKIIYFSDEEDSGVILNLFYPDIPNESGCSQSSLDEGMSYYDHNMNSIDETDSIKIPTHFTHPNIGQIIAYLKDCGIKENYGVGFSSIDGYFFEKI